MRREVIDRYGIARLAGRARGKVRPLAGACLGMIVMLGVACGGGGGSPKTATSVGPTAAAAGTPGQSATPASVATPGQTVTAAGSATAAPAQTPAAVDLTPALLQASDLPASLTLRPPVSQAVRPGEVPGLTTSGSGARQQAVSAGKMQFLTLILVAPDSGGPQSMLDAVTSDKYLPTLTSNARDAQWTELPVSGAPAGSRSYSYTATATSPAQQQVQLHGSLVAFTQGNVFVLLNYGSYEAGDAPPDLNALASTVASRLSALPQ